MGAGRRKSKPSGSDKEAWDAWINGTVPAASEDVVEPVKEDLIEKETTVICKPATMSFKDKSTIHRMLGIIEGVAFCLEDKLATPLFDAVSVISEILDREGGANDV